MTMQSTKFSRSSKEGRGDASVWTDTPSDRAQKAKMKYVSLYLSLILIQELGFCKKYDRQ